MGATTLTRRNEALPKMPSGDGVNPVKSGGRFPPTSIVFGASQFFLNFALRLMLRCIKTHGKIIRSHGKTYYVLW